MLNIHPLYFFISFAIGTLCVYVITPPAEIVLKFPSPYNAGNVTYRDKANNCYRYKANKVKCGESASKVKHQPILEDFKLREFFKQLRVENEME